MSIKTGGPNRTSYEMTRLGQLDGMVATALATITTATTEGLKTPAPVISAVYKVTSKSTAERRRKLLLIRV